MDHDPDPTAADPALDRLGHDELALALHRLYAQLGETPLAASALLASTTDELRLRVRVVRRRLVRRASPTTMPGEPAGPTGTTGTGTGTSADLAPTPDPGGAHPASGRAAVPRRRILLLLTTDPVLVDRARDAGRPRAIVVVPADSPAGLRILIASVTPALVVLDTRGPAIDASLEHDLFRRRLLVRRGTCADSCLTAMADLP
ncbi:MAG: hypothetical protein HS111_39835 [Kofleriaceae bacterium]|nr:hypothetical protein [Kofleriaceae bacterium]MCL4228646.1 hypothetical protein [Myxococcales bacterium]